jgi:PadR family transcriptional regulator, regulatory protein PadR
MNHERARGHLDLLLLAVLASRPAHGYAVIAALRQRSAGEFDLPEGTVYPALHRLERTGLLTSAWADGSGRRRREYQITMPGRTALAARRREWYGFANAVRLVVGWAT